MKHPRCLLAITGAFSLGGGIAAVNRLVLRTLSEEGYSVDILALCEHQATVDDRYVDPDTVVVRVFGNRKIPFTFAVWRALITQRYELVMFDLINLASILALPGLLGLCRYIVWLYGVEVFPEFLNKEGVAGIRGAWRRIAISEFTQSQVAARWNNLSVAVCHLALDPVRHPFDHEFVSNIQRPTLSLKAVDGSNYAIGERVVLCVGYMRAAMMRKGQAVLIEAMTYILDEFPGAQLILAGSGDGMPQILSIARSQPETVQRAIFLPGFVSDKLLTQLYQASSVFAMPSAGEGFGLVYLEAMQWGIPCIGSKVDAAGTVIQDGQTGVLIGNPNSREDLAQAIKSLLADPDRATRLGSAGRALVQSQYLFPHFKERLMTILAVNS